MRKNVLFILLLPLAVLASGGDTIHFSTAVQSLSDNDTFFADKHYHAMKDSIAKVVNGRLGNVNIAADAQIDAGKMDTTKTLKIRKVKADSVRVAGYVADDSTYSTRAVKTSRIQGDSLKVSKISGKVAGDSITDLDTVYSDKAHFKMFNVDTVLGSTIFKEHTPGYLYYQHVYTINDTNRLRVELNSIHDVLFTICGANFTWRRLIGATYANIFRLDSADTSFRVYGRMGIGQAPTAYRLTVNGLVGSAGVTTNSRDTLTYTDTSVADTMFQSGAALAVGTIRIIKAGASVLVDIPSLTGTCDGIHQTDIHGVPASLWPTHNMYFPVTLNVASIGVVTGVIHFNLSGQYFRVYWINSNAFEVFASGSNTFYGTKISWIK
jgi:hypothetical protein